MLRWCLGMIIWNRCNPCHGCTCVKRAEHFIVHLEYKLWLYTPKKELVAGQGKKQANQITGETFPLRESLSVLQKGKNGYIMDLFLYS